MTPFNLFDYCVTTPWHPLRVIINTALIASTNTSFRDKRPQKAIYKYNASLHGPGTFIGPNGSCLALVICLDGMQFMVWREKTKYTKHLHIYLNRNTYWLSLCSLVNKFSQMWTSKNQSLYISPGPRSYDSIHCN